MLGFIFIAVMAANPMVVLTHRETTIGATLDKTLAQNQCEAEQSQSSKKLFNLQHMADCMERFGHKSFSFSRTGTLRFHD